MMKWIKCIMRVKINSSRSCLDVKCGSLIGSLCSTSKSLCSFMDLFACDRSSKPTHHVCKQVGDNPPEVWEETSTYFLPFDVMILYTANFFCRLFRLKRHKSKSCMVKKPCKEAVTTLELNTSTKPKWKATFRTQFK